MAPNIENLYNRAQEVEENLSTLAAKGSSAELAALLQEYRVACEDVILSDFEYAAAKEVETQLWGAHLKINGIYRKELRALKRERVVEARKTGKQYLAFIKASQRFYRQHILLLDAQVDGIPELRKVAQKLTDEASAIPLRKRFPAHLKHQVLLSCHQTLIQLGDLSRYRESELVEKDRNWGPAKGYYNLAAEVYPESGHSHNQLAVIAREDGDHFRSTYHLYRSLASKEPHPLAKQNLGVGFKKIVTAWEKGELINSHNAADGNNVGRALVAWFVRLHSKCYRGEEFAQHDELENEVLSQLTIELKERPLDSILQKIILINLAAEYFATIQMQSSDAPENIMRTYFYYLRLNVKTFFTLLQILQSELERLSEGDDVTQHGNRAPRLSDKITAVARRVLPGLRLYSTWFSRYWRVLDANVASTLTKVEVQELWKAYAATLTLLASSFPADQLPPHSDSYMLEEDTETIGFQPLISPDTMKVWYDGANLKKKWSDVERSHPTIEMLMRVRDFLVDGLTLTQLEEAPLGLDGLRFVYEEAGLPSELLASPNNRPDGSPSIIATPMAVPLFPQEIPVADDQKSYSVAAPSESSTTLAKDFAMNQMVDDLVGADDGLDPLPEEDENIPPTPPEQTFEDTMVTEDVYGQAAFSISDLVSSVQNYKKPALSPAPLYATPMDRSASSSSIRQPAALPSLPNGQHTGTSIWNPHYTGTPGPSSPLLPNGNAVRVPSRNGGPPPGFSGHARGNSSNSIHSSDWNGSSSTPTLRPPPGFGGASWGNPAAPGYYLPHGQNHGYNGNPHVNPTDLNLASPLLFGRGTWDSDAVHSSYGRTPPNGQGG